jgi:hypothetical protein
VFKNVEKVESFFSLCHGAFVTIYSSFSPSNSNISGIAHCSSSLESFDGIYPSFFACTAGGTA